jgi:hypothetical protein
MKFSVPIGYDVPRQCEITKDVKLSDKQLKAIVQDFFNRMDYEQREAWLRQNLRNFYKGV